MSGADGRDKLSPPRPAARLLELVLDERAHEAIAGDLEEEFRRKCLLDGIPAGKRWFWRQSFSSIASVVLDSMRREPRTGSRKGDPMWIRLARDCRFALRALVRSPGFTLTVVLVLALGMAATLTIHALVQNFLRRPLHLAEPDRVAFVLGWDTSRDAMRFSTALADNVEIKETAQSLREVAAYQYWSVNLAGGGTPERAQGYRVSSNLFDLLGVRPGLGSTFSVGAGDHQVVLAHTLWQRRFGADPAIVGESVLLDGEQHVVVGVMPREFEFPLFNFKGELFAPFPGVPASTLSDRADLGGQSVVTVARLADSSTKASAQAELDAIGERLAASYPETNRDVGFRLSPIGELLSSQMGPALWLLFAAVGLVLLIACANVTQLLLSRGLSRRGELSVRAAIGASRAQLFSTVAMESLILAMAGGALGLALTPSLLRAVQSLLPGAVLSALPVVDVFSVSGSTLAFSLVLVVVAGMLFGLPSAFIAARQTVTGVDTGRRVAGNASTRMRRVLVVAQLALCLVLLVGGGLVLRTVVRLLQTDPGFDVKNASAFSVALSGARYPDPDAYYDFYTSFARKVRSLGGVEAAGWVNSVPFSTSDSGTAFAVSGVPAEPDAARPRARYRVVSPGYLRALGSTLLAGRDFDASDLSERRAVALVNRSLADEFLDGDPLDKVLLLGRDQRQTPLRVVGVVPDIAHGSLLESARAEIYVPLVFDPRGEMSLVVRSSQPVPSLMALVRAELSQLDPEQPIFQTASLEDLVRTSLFAQRVVLAVLSVFGASTLILSSIGLYGLIAFVASQRQRELGIRLALGATPRDLATMVLTGGLRLTLAGVAAGLVGALLLARVLANVFEGLDSADPLVFIGCTLVLGFVALMACYLPARKARSVDPASTLRL